MIVLLVVMPSHAIVMMVIVMRSMTIVMIKDGDDEGDSGADDFSST